MSEDKMREEFEAAYTAGDIYMVERTSSIQFECIYKQRAWAAWRASRAALVVKLPQGSEPGDFAHPVMVAEVESVISAIEAAGVRVKQ